MSFFIFLFLMFPYLTYLMWLHVSAKHLKIDSLEKDISAKTNFSVIFSATDEFFEAEILISQLIHQNYPSKLFEVIIHIDGNKDLFQKLSKTYGKVKNIKFIFSENQIGKKQGLHFLIEESSSEHIIQLDADASIQPNFLLSYDQLIRKHQPVCIIGMVLPNIEPTDSFLQKFMALDFMSLQAIQTAFILRSKPNLANGTNLYFLKSSYFEISENLLKISSPSGDDVFLVQNLFLQNKKIIWGNIIEGSVITPIPESISAFINQRARWGSKTKHYLSTHLKILAIVVLIANMSLVFGVISLFLGKIILSALVILFGIKALFDLIFIKKIIQIYQLNFLLNAFIQASILYPFYIIIASFKAIFGMFTWKGKTY